MIQCINDYLVVKNIPHEPGGKIFIPPQFKKNLRALQQGTVISAGPGTELLPMPVKAGDVVVYDKPFGFDVDLNGETHRVLQSFQIICAK